MFKVLVVALACGLILVGSGCVAVGTPIAGTIYTNVKGPMDVVDNGVGCTKTGTSEATGILGFASGDASIATAAKSVGITKIHHVDTESMNVLMVYGKFKTVVYGD